MNIGVGKAYVVNPIDEAARLKKALNAQKQEYEKLFESIDEKEGDIFFWYIALLEDETLLSKLLGFVNKGDSAESAINKAFDEIITDFKSNKNKLIQSRAEDLYDIKHSLLKKLASEKRLDFSSVPGGAVLVTKRITPSAVCSFNSNKISAIVTATGSPLSHTAILAKARGIPIVLSPKNFDEIENGDILIVNSDTKTVIIDKYKN